MAGEEARLQLLQVLHACAEDASIGGGRRDALHIWPAETRGGRNEPAVSVHRSFEISPGVSVTVFRAGVIATHSYFYL